MKNFLELPEGIKILSALTLLASFSLILIGISIAGLYDIASVDRAFLAQQGLPALSSWNYLILGLLTIVVGYLFYKLATRGLNQGKAWAKHTIAILMILLAINPVRGMFAGRIVGGILIFLVYALVFWYVVFSKEAKKYFRK